MGPIQFPAAFTYSRFRFRVRLMDGAMLPVFKGSMLRGVMGEAIHRLNCQSRGSCDKCKLVKNCAYSILFKPELIQKDILYAPPFVLYSPNKKEKFNKNDQFEFTLTIFGEYSRYFDYFFNAFNYACGMGLSNRRIPYEIEEITDDVSREWIYKDRDVNKDWQVSAASLSSLEPESHKNLRIDFLSPVFLKKNKKPIYFPDIKEIIRVVIRRIHILSRTVWNDANFKIDNSFLDDLQVSIIRYDLKYEKTYKTGGLGRKVELSGFYGSIECSGDFTWLYLLLKAGEVLHIGVRTSYGLGKYEITVL